MRPVAARERKSLSERFLGVQEDWTVQSGRYQGACFSLLEGRALCVGGAPVRVRASRQTRLLFVRLAAVHESPSGGCFEAVRTEVPPRPSRGWRGLRGGAFRASVVLPAGYPYSERRMRAASRRPFPPGPLELTKPPLSQQITEAYSFDCCCRTWDETSRLSTRSQPARLAFGIQGLRRPGSEHFLGVQED